MYTCIKHLFAHFSDYVADSCNSTLNMSSIGSQIGILQYSNDPTSQFYTNTNCKVTLVAKERYNIGLQLLVVPDRSSSDCDSRVSVNTGNNTYIHCLQSAVLEGEFTSVKNEIKLLFTDERRVSPTLNTGSDVSDTGGDVTVIFYSYTIKNSDGACAEALTQGCQNSARCVHLSLSDHLEEYNICQNTDVVQRYSDTSSKPQSSFIGVIVFAATLALLFIVLIAMQFFRKQPMCKVIRGLLCLDYDDTENLNVNQSTERPRFTLGDPPPSYSDLSFAGGFQNPNLDPGDMFPSQTEHNQQAGIWIDSVNNLGIPKTLSSGRISTTSTLPPSYSEVIIHKEKYNVQDDHNVTDLEPS